FAEIVPGSVAGFVYVDTNDNAVKEAGEPGISGVTITLTGTNDVGPVSLPASTAADGSYQFPNVRPGNYSITESEPAGYLHGKDALGSLGGNLVSDHVLALALGTGVSGSNYNFAAVGFNSLAGYVYLDANNNGAKDPAEAGIAGVALTLVGVNDQGPVNLNTTTAND